MLADDPFRVDLRGDSAQDSAHPPLFGQAARPDGRGAWALRSFPSGAPAGHSRGIWVRCRGKGDASAMTAATTRFSGRAFSVQEVMLSRKIVRACPGLSRMELARTLCELLRWRRPNGRLKARDAKRRLRER